MTLPLATVDWFKRTKTRRLTLVHAKVVTGFIKNYAHEADIKSAQKNVVIWCLYNQQTCTSCRNLQAKMSSLTEPRAETENAPWRMNIIYLRLGWCRHKLTGRVSNVPKTPKTGHAEYLHTRFINANKLLLRDWAHIFEYMRHLLYSARYYWIVTKRPHATPSILFRYTQIIQRKCPTTVVIYVGADGGSFF